MPNGLSCYINGEHRSQMFSFMQGFTSFTVLFCRLNNLLIKDGNAERSKLKLGKIIDKYIAIWYPFISVLVFYCDNFHVSELDIMKSKNLRSALIRLELFCFELVLTTSIFTKYCLYHRWWAQDCDGGRWFKQSKRAHPFFN